MLVFAWFSCANMSWKRYRLWRFEPATWNTRIRNGASVLCHRSAKKRTWHAILTGSKRTVKPCYNGLRFVLNMIRKIKFFFFIFGVGNWNLLRKLLYTIRTPVPSTLQKKLHVGKATPIIFNFSLFAYEYRVFQICNVDVKNCTNVFDSTCINVGALLVQNVVYNH